MMKILKLFKCGIRYIFNSEYRFKKNASFRFLDNMSDEEFLKKMYRYCLKKDLNLNDPQTFNEKLQWLKLYDRKPIYTTMVDKYEVKKYVADIIGEEYIIPTLGVWDKFEDINFDSLPEQFVLKCTHDSGGLVICKDKSKLDMDSTRKRVNKFLKREYYWKWREWPYKDVKPRIIVEKYMQDRANAVLPVFKFFCFNGKPKIIQTIQNDKQKNESIDYFDTEWNLLELRQNFPNSEKPFEKPEKLSEMLTLAETLAKDSSPFIRVDFYEINGMVYFSEFTFYSDAGLAKFEPEEWDRILGSWIQLPV